MTTNEYLTVKCYLWKGRYPELVEVFENGVVKQSMEIAVEGGNWDENWEYFNITKARFTALCLLGVEPCFESSKATIGYSLNDKESLYQEMLDRFKQFELEKAGGEIMPEETVQNVQEVQEEVQVEEPVQETETIDAVVEETIETAPQPVEDTVVEEEVVEEVVESTPATPEPEIEEAPVDTEDLQVVEYQTRVAELEEALQEAKRELETLKQENERLADFEASVKAEQRKAEQEALFARFESLEGYEGYSELVEKAHQYSLEDLEVKLFALLGRKNFSMTQKPKKSGSAKLSVGATVRNDNEVYYGGRFDKYFK